MPLRRKRKSLYRKKVGQIKKKKMAQNPDVILKTKTPFFQDNPRLIIVGCAVFALFFMVGFLVSRYNPSLPPITNQFLLQQSATSPVSLELLQNPMFQNWTARVEGRLSSKDSSSFIITNVIRFVSATGSAVIKDANDGKALQIVYIKDKTVFQKINPKKEGELASIDLPGLPIGSLVNGIIEIYKTGDQWFLVGKGFTTI